MAIDVPAKIRAGVAKARAETLNMMVDVGHIRVIGRDENGPVYSPSTITRKAIVEDVGEAVVGQDGNERLSASKLTFLEPVEVDEFDIFVLKGVQLNVAKRAGLLDPDGVPYFVEVWLGQGRWR